MRQNLPIPLPLTMTANNESPTSYFHLSYFRPANGKIRRLRNFVFGVFAGGQITCASRPFAIKKLPVKMLF